LQGGHKVPGQPRYQQNAHGKERDVHVIG
jgi:hypothetical protein